MSPEDDDLSDYNDIHDALLFNVEDWDFLEDDE